MLETTSLTTDFLAAEFAEALPYTDYLQTGDDHQREAFTRVYNQATLTPAQHELLTAATREMRVLVLSGMWCGDCVAQCPLLARIAEANPSKILLRFADPADHPELANRATINQGHRVPAAIFMAEDHEFVHLLGDRTLSRYRAVAARQLGAACELPSASIADDEVAATLQDWVNEFERVQLLLRLSPRLRQKHND